MRQCLLMIFVVLGLFTHQQTIAGFDNFDFSGDVTEKRFQNVISKLRCLVCQNESLAGSQAELAKDLRREVYDLMTSGKTDKEVIDFLVSRYGDFVLYQPPVKPSTWLLWIGPFVLFAIALFMLLRKLARRSKMQEVVLSDSEKNRIQQLLEQTSPDSANDNRE